MSGTAAAEFLARLDREMRLPKRLRHDLVAEARSGLDDALAAARSVAAERAVVESFGDPVRLAEQYEYALALRLMRRSARIIAVFLLGQFAVWATLWSTVWSEAGSASGGSLSGLLYAALVVIGTVPAVAILWRTRAAVLPDSWRARRALRRHNLLGSISVVALIGLTLLRLNSRLGGVRPLTSTSTFALVVHLVATGSAVVVVGYVARWAWIARPALS